MMLANHRLLVQFWPNQKKHPNSGSVTLPLQVFVCSDHLKEVVLDDVYPRALRIATTMAMISGGAAPPDWSTARLLAMELAA